MIIGALMGFLIGSGFGLSRQGDWPGTFWKACVTAYLAGMLMKWWAKTWMKALEETLQKKARQETAPEEAPTA